MKDPETQICDEAKKNKKIIITIIYIFFFFCDEAKYRTFLESLPDAFFRSRKEDMSGKKRTSGHPM